MRTPINWALTAPLHGWSAVIHQNNVEKGFWPENRNLGEAIALMHSELSEALDEHRAGRPVLWYKHDDECHDPDEFGGGSKDSPGCVYCVMKPEGMAVELMDAIIRELDVLFKILEPTPHTIDDIAVIKMEYNKQREYMHGKAY